MTAVPDCTRSGALSARIVTGVLLGLTVLMSPNVLGSFVVLDWELGDIRPVARHLQTVCAALTLVSLFMQAQIATLYRRVFPTRRALGFSAIGIALSSLCTLAILEVILRVFDFPFSNPSIPPGRNALEYARARFDSEVGWTYKPNWNGVEESTGRERRRVPIHFDAIGARVRDAGDVHDPTAPTVLFVGCSFTMGYGVPYEETFPGVLSSMPNFPFQVVNLGVEAYGTDQAWLLLKRHVKRFNTKAVVYTFMVDHPARNRNYDRRLHFRGMRYVGTKPLFALRGDGNLFLDRPALPYDQISTWHLWATLEYEWAHRGPEPTLDLTRALVKEMKEHLESSRVPLVVVAWDWYRDKLAATRNEWPPFRDLDVPVVDTAADPPTGWSQWQIPGDSHPNARAHRHVAELLFGEFARLGMLEPAGTHAQVTSLGELRRASATDGVVR